MRGSDVATILPSDPLLLLLLAYSIIRVYFQSILSLDTLAGTETKNNNKQQQQKQCWRADHGMHF